MSQFLGNFYNIIDEYEILFARNYLHPSQFNITIDKSFKLANISEYFRIIMEKIHSSNELKIEKNTMSDFYHAFWYDLEKLLCFFNARIVEINEKYKENAKSTIIGTEAYLRTDNLINIISVKYVKFLEEKFKIKNSNQTENKNDKK